MLLRSYELGNKEGAMKVLEDETKYVDRTGKAFV